MPVKKAIKKTVAKKRPAKKTARRKVAKKPLVYADNEKSFWCTDGQILNSLVALKDALNVMEKEVFEYHAGKAHNDFATWAETVLSDSVCARSLKKAKTPKSAKAAVVKRLKVYAF